jgi:hypothetical protein
LHIFNKVMIQEWWTTFKGICHVRAISHRAEDHPTEKSLGDDILFCSEKLPGSELQRRTRETFKLCHFPITEL